MSRPYKTTITGTGSGATNTAPYIPNYQITPFNVSLAIDTDGSTTTGTIQYTLDDLATVTAGNAVWFDHPDADGVTVDTVVNIAFPVTAIRLQAGATGTDTWTFWILQAGIAN